MILGVDHVAIAGRGGANEGEALEAFGLKRRFAGVGIANAAQKKKFLRRYDPTHDLALFDGDSGTAIEITNHRVERGSVAEYGFVPLLKLRDANHGGLKEADAPRDVAAAVIAAFEVGDVSYRWMPDFSAPVWIALGEKTGLAGLVLAAANFDATVRFFSEGFGLVPRTGSTKSRQWVRFDIRSMVPRWNSSLLIYGALAGEDAVQPRLDDAGFPCLALLSNDLAADQERLLAVFPDTEIARFSLTVDRKPLDFLLATSPGGHIIELIQARKS